MTTKIVFIGEAWGKDEEIYRRPFVGAAGQELWRMLGDAGFSCSTLPYHFVSPARMVGLWSDFPYPLLNVFNERPPKNDVNFFYAHLSDKVPVNRELGKRRSGSSNIWVQEKHTHHIHKLHEDLTRLKPNLIVPLGATACWALGIPGGIGANRGRLFETKWGKALPVYHPAAILRGWDNRIFVVLDSLKAMREMKYPELRTPVRYIWTEPTISDLYAWWDEYGKNSSLLAVDIETVRNEQISEVGFAASSTHAIHIPFVIEKKEGNRKTYRQWWPDTATEVRAWEFVKMVCESPIPKIGQNVVQYDAYWLVKEMGIALMNVTEDTMTKSHCWQPELDKDLGTLGSIFCDEKAWKHIRKDTGKDND